ncbi:MAG: beta/gamma crystallin domain-containing protein [bacterium]
MKTRKLKLAAVLGASSALACAGALATAAEGKEDGSAARGDTATQDRSAQEGKSGASTFTARVPVLVMVPMEFKVDPQAKGCWVELYSKDSFQGAALTLVGPLDMATMRGPFGFDWENEIESIKTGPKATIRMYDNENFKEHSEWVGPGKEVKDLDDRMELFDSFRSMKVDC